MAKKLGSVLGIDIGSRKIKVCEIKSQGKEPAVTALGIIDTPEGAVDHSGIYNAEAVGVALKTVLQQAGASTGAAVVSLAGQNSVLVRTLEVPKMNNDELKEHMAWEINRNIPFAESTVVSDFKPLGGDDPNSPNMDVVMAIAPQSAIDTVLQAIKKAGKSAAALDVEPLSMARSIAMSYADLPATETVCVVDMGASTCAINIFSNNKLLMPRQIPIGGDMFTQAIANEYALPMSEAEALKFGTVIPENAAELRMAVVNPFDIPGSPTQEFQPYNPFADDTPAPLASVDPFAEPATEVIEEVVYEEPVVELTTAIAPQDAEQARRFNAIAPLLDDFVSEIRRSIDYFRSRGGNVDSVLLTGGGTKLAGLARFVGTAIGVPCDAYDPFRRLNLNVKKIAPDFVNEHRQEFAVAIGNGLWIFFD
jgi:type IV pilus assembly protein PilM